VNRNKTTREPCEESEDVKSGLSRTWDLYVPVSASGEVLLTSGSAEDHLATAKCSTAASNYY